MPKIVLSDDAPSGDLRFSLANAEIEELPYETSDAVVVANAVAHPWLTVEFEEVEQLADQSNPFQQTSPEDDVLGHLNDNSNDPDAVRAEIARRVDEKGSDPVAIEAGLDQRDVVVTASGVSETIAADNASDRKVANAQKRAADAGEKEND